MRKFKWKYQRIKKINTDLFNEQSKIKDAKIKLIERNEDLEKKNKELKSEIEQLKNSNGDTDDKKDDKINELQQNLLKIIDENAALTKEKDKLKEEILERNEKMEEYKSIEEKMNKLIEGEKYFGKKNRWIKWR